MKRDGSKSARRSIMMTIGGGLGLSMVVAVATGGSPFEHPMFQMVGRAAAAAGVTAVAQQARIGINSQNQQGSTLDPLACVAWLFTMPSTTHHVWQRRALGLGSDLLAERVLRSAAI